MSRPVSILLVADDPDLATEWQAVEAGLTDLRVLPHFASNPREGVLIAKSRQPDVVCLAPPRSVDELDNVVQELQDAAPHAQLIGVLDRRQFESGDAESEIVVSATRAGLRDFLRRPLSSLEVQACLRRLEDAERRPSRPTRTGTVVCFVSNKGGVGKTTLAVNVAADLAQRNLGSVLIVDAALQLGLCATMLDLEPTVTMHDVVTQIDRLDETLLRELTVQHHCGLDLLAAPGDAVEAAGVREDHLSRILAVARTAYDYVVVDTFPILDGIAIAALDRADQVWQVVAPTVPTVLGAERLADLLEGVGVETDRQRVVLNVSVPAHAGQLSAQDVATRLDRDVAITVPFCRGAVSSCNSGEPVVLGSRRHGAFRRRIRDLADTVVESARPAVTAGETG